MSLSMTFDPVCVCVCVSAGLKRKTSTWREPWNRTKARWQRKRRSVFFSDVISQAKKEQDDMYSTKS